MTAKEETARIALIEKCRELRKVTIAVERITSAIVVANRLAWEAKEKQAEGNKEAAHDLELSEQSALNLKGQLEAARASLVRLQQEMALLAASATVEAPGPVLPE